MRQSIQIGLTITAKDRFVTKTGGRVFDIVSRENPSNQNRFQIFLLKENVDG